MELFGLEVSDMWVWFSTIIAGWFIIKWLFSLPKVGKLNEKYVLITGCDSGFGKATALRLDKLGLNVIAACLTSQGAAELKNKCSTRVKTIILNITSEEDIGKALDSVQQIIPRDKGLWALVNNAGVSGLVSMFESTTHQDVMDCLNVNLLGMMDVTRAFLPLIREEKGRVVNLGSITGRFAQLPIIYSTSKYALEGFSDGLRREVYTQGISVQIIEPGLFNTGILTAEKSFVGFRKAFFRSKKEFQNYYGEDFPRRMTDYMTHELSMAPTDVEPVITDLIHAITARYPEYRYLPGQDAKLKFRFLWTLPTWLGDLIYNAVAPSPRHAAIKLPRIPR